MVDLGEFWRLIVGWEFLAKNEGFWDTVGFFGNLANFGAKNNSNFWVKNSWNFYCNLEIIVKIPALPNFP
jgi:hypothetical protein